ncbi:hypothetical protein LAZ67_4002646 [Cordylochernes scorpioides]|uniref:PUL domain-containing protein n=1 Tax=Cordylochernes scorpioides TaxID=51811 RepID=A0ABY6KD63_9ARAC|nr:hypothetical protein LAZ67_4002646 [Cordylochernes scorpioides]
MEAMLREVNTNRVPENLMLEASEMDALSRFIESQDESESLIKNALIKMKNWPVEVRFIFFDYLRVLLACKFTGALHLDNFPLPNSLYDHIPMHLNSNIHPSYCTMLLLECCCNMFALSDGRKLMLTHSIFVKQKFAALYSAKDPWLCPRISALICNYMRCEVHAKEDAHEASTSVTKIERFKHAMLLLESVNDPRNMYNLLFGLNLFLADADLKDYLIRFLTNEKKLCRLSTCEDMLEMKRTDLEWKDKIITGDETWVYGYDPETKLQSAEWRGLGIAPNDFFLFPKLKAVLKGRHFETRDDIIEKSLLALKSILKEAYKNCFDNWEKRWRCHPGIHKCCSTSEKIQSHVEANLEPLHPSIIFQCIHVELAGNEMTDILIEAAQRQPKSRPQQVMPEKEEFFNLSHRCRAHGEGQIRG